MKTSRLILGTIALAAIAPAFGQVRVASRGSGGWGAASPYNLLYNHNSVVEFDGKVIGVQRSSPMPDMGISVSLLVKSSNGGTSMVDLGPAWYVDNLETKINLKDRVHVTGSKVFSGGKSTILAQSVVRNNRVMYLRGEDGFPMWVAWRGHVTVASNNNANNTGVAEVAPGVTALTGYVSDIIEVPVGQSGGPSSVIVLTGDNGNRWNVDLGPVWFLNRQDMFFTLGDAVTVFPEGTMVNNFFRANRVVRGPQILFLRNRFGQPTWMGLQNGGGR